VVIGYSPGIEKHGFDVEYEEQHCDDIITDGELLMGVHEGGDAGLVGQQLFGIGVPWPEDPAEDKHPDADGGAEQQKNNHGQKVFRKIGTWCHTLNSLLLNFGLAELLKRAHDKPCKKICQAKHLKKELFGSVLNRALR
jgi:hypothetical protein